MKYISEEAFDRAADLWVAIQDAKEALRGHPGPLAYKLGELQRIKNMQRERLQLLGMEQ